jgi:hypothetical protein
MQARTHMLLDGSAEVEKTFKSHLSRKARSWHQTRFTFHIGVDDVNKCVNEVVQFIKEDNKNFAILMPVSVTSEMARLEN